MEKFSVPSGRRAERAQLMGRMMGRLGLDLESVARETLGTRLRAVVFRCRHCRQADLCERWVSGDEMGYSYRDFCPNAETFDDFCQR